MVAQNTGLDLKNLLFAATMIASLGAVMDVAVSLLSALWELGKESLPGRIWLVLTNCRLLKTGRAGLVSLA